MKKVLAALTGILFLAACDNPNAGEGGVINDGIETVDPNGALVDTMAGYPSPGIDTSIGEHRVDLQPRGDIDTTFGQ